MTSQLSLGLLEAGAFDIFSVLSLLCGLALFLFGMEVMGDSLKKSAGSSLKAILGKMTSNPISGFFLGLVVTAVIQSSSATTVMVVGFVNSGTMTLLQATGVIIGANVGTSVTSWITALSGLDASIGEVTGFMEYLKPDFWMPILAVIGILLIMSSARGRKKDIGGILLGFAVLMVGMDMMSAAVNPLKTNEEFANILTLFENPVLGVILGAVMTAIIQSSSASVGILQSLTATGAISFNMSVPIIMGQNIGTCITALISSSGANKNGKRAAIVHLLFNTIGTLIVLPLFYLVSWLLSSANIFDVSAIETVDGWTIAIIHTIFNITNSLLLLPLYRVLAKISTLIVRDKPEEIETANLLDERLLGTPTIAVERAGQVTVTMASLSLSAFRDSLTLFDKYDQKLADEIRELEGKVDVLEDTIGTYLLKVSACDLDDRDTREVTKLLHMIGDLERISDHAVNIVESAEEMRDKKVSFSDEATRELEIMRGAIVEILGLTESALVGDDLTAAVNIEPLEQVVDGLRDQIKLNHVRRLQKSECTIEHGFILNDILTNLERVSDHCSNLGGCVIEITSEDRLDLHKYLDELKHSGGAFDAKFKEYSEKYAL